MTLPLIRLGHISQLLATILPAAFSTFSCQIADHCQGLVGSVAMETEPSSKIQNPGGRGFFFLMDNVLSGNLSPVEEGGGNSMPFTGSDVGRVWGLAEAQLCGCGVWGGENRAFTLSVLGGGLGAVLAHCRCHSWRTSGECGQWAFSLRKHLHAPRPPGSERAVPSSFQKPGCASHWQGSEQGSREARLGYMA